MLWGEQNGLLTDAALFNATLMSGHRYEHGEFADISGRPLQRDTDVWTQPFLQILLRGLDAALFNATLMSGHSKYRAASGNSMAALFNATLMSGHERTDEIITPVADAALFNATLMSGHSAAATLLAMLMSPPSSTRH